MAVIVMSAAVISCSMVRDFRNRPSEKTRKLNESIPAGLENAESDYRIDDPSIFKIILPEPGQILLQDPDSQPIDLATLGRNVKEFAATKSPDMKVVYLAASVSIPSIEISNILDELRKQDIDRLSLLTSGRDSNQEGKGWFPSEIGGPDRVLEVKIRNPVAVTDRPNPLTLVVSFDAKSGPMLNNEPQEDLKALAQKLREIFKQRESNGVFREGTNEVEKTVVIKWADEGADQKYGDIMKMIDSAKGGGANPIVLTDEGIPWEIPLRPVATASPKDPTQKNLPKVISGGVLNGKATSLPKPPYPAAARAVNASGFVSVQVTVDIDGKVITANAVSGHPLLRPAAVAAARSAQFLPTLLSGQPVKISGVLTYNFVP